MIIEKTSSSSHSSPILAAPAPRKWELWTLRSLALMGLVAMGIFLYWFFQPQHIGYLPLYVLLNLALLFKMLVLLHEWYHYVGISVPEKPEQKSSFTVDMLTTFVPGEPYGMIEETLKAMKAVQYPHETYLCDEGNDPYLIELCERLGVHHSYRGKDKTNAKAGNINYALRTQAKGDIAVILDPDHVPIPEMLDRLLPYFEDEKMGYVQSVQAYKNRNESFIAKGAAEQTYQFYGPMMMSMSGYGSAQAIGANCAFRREALDSIGGHAPGLAEDMHTAMQLHAKGWKSVYVPEVLTRGLVPATLAGYYSQQLKWSRGVFELLFAALPKLLKGLNWRQWVHYFTIPLYFFYGVVTLIDIFVPIAALFLSKAPWQVDVLMFFFLLLPLSILSMLIRQFSQRWVLEEHERGFHFIGGVLRSGTWWVFVTGFVYTLLRIKVPYIPTPKDDELSNAWKLSLPNLVAIGLSLVAIGYGLYVDWTPYNWVMAAFAGTNVIILSLVVLMSQQKLIAGFFEGLYGKRFRPIRTAWYNFRHNLLYKGLRKGFVVFGMAALAIFSTGTFLTHKPSTDLSKKPLSLSLPTRDVQLPPYSSSINSPSLQVAAYGWNWMVDGEPFQVKAIAYHTTPLWYTNEFPLTRRQLLRDFQLIKDMGANTVRRYQSDVFDHNVLQVAEEIGLKVIFGFDIPASLDFGGDEAKKLKGEIIASIRQRGLHPSILAWTFGQETWQQQGLHWSEQELASQRAQYLGWMKQLLSEVRAIDDTHPILLSFSPDSNLREMVGLHLQAAPQIDLIGINAFYPEAFQRAQTALQDIQAIRPLLLSEFGPVGYWEEGLSPRERNGQLAEPTDFEKVAAYQTWWKQIDTAQHWVGGAAYNWQDIHSGTSTWFGLTDHKGRLKPAYYGLASLWGDDKRNFPLPEVYLSPSDPLWYRRPQLEMAAVSPLLETGEYELEWYLKEETHGTSRNFKKLGTSRKITFDIPKDRSRLYLYLSDDQGNVTSASRVINP